MKIDDRLHSLTTIIEINDTHEKGTGFFYHILGEKDPSKGLQWTEVKKIFLVTNRHIILPEMDGKEKIPNRIIFHLRAIKDNNIVWFPISLNQKEILKRVKVHKDPSIDVVIIEIGDLVVDAGIKTPITYSCIGEDDFIGKNKISAEVTDDIIVVGYPIGYYDSHNKFPVIKGGIIASRWLAPFEAKPIFLIDTKLFPGSSGSIVITKPMNFIIDNGAIFTNNDKQFSFLGIYSGESVKDITNGEVTIPKHMNLGCVWYFYLIPEIINDGVSLDKIEK